MWPFGTSHRLVVPFMDCRLWSSATFSNAGQIVASVHTFTPPHNLPCWDHLGLHVLLDPLLNSSPPLSPPPHPPTHTGWCHRVPVTLHLPCSRLFWAGSQPPLCTATLLPRTLPSARPAKQDLWVGKQISASCRFSGAHGSGPRSLDITLAPPVPTAGWETERGMIGVKDGVLLGRTWQSNEELRKTECSVL